MAKFAFARTTFEEVELLLSIVEGESELAALRKQLSSYFADDEELLEKLKVPVTVEELQTMAAEWGLATEIISVDYVDSRR
jgi:hypothetical protein